MKKKSTTILGLAALVLATGTLQGCSLNGEASFKVTVDPSKCFRVSHTDVELSDGSVISYNDYYVYAKVENTSKSALFNSAMSMSFNQHLYPTAVEQAPGEGGGVVLENAEGYQSFRAYNPDQVIYAMGLKEKPIQGYVSTLDAGESQEVYLMLPGYADKQDVSYSGLTKMVGLCVGNYVFTDVFGGDDVYGYFQEYVDVEAEE